MGSIPSRICCNLVIDSILVLGPTFQSQASERFRLVPFADTTRIHIGSMGSTVCVVGL